MSWYRQYSAVQYLMKHCKGCCSLGGQQDGMRGSFFSSSFVSPCVRELCTEGNNRGLVGFGMQRKDGRRRLESIFAALSTATSN